MSFDIPQLAAVCPHLIVVNCAGCGELLQAEGQKLNVLPEVHGHIMGRSYCWNCLRLRPNLKPGLSAMPDDISPWQENAIRLMEGE